MPTQPDEHDKPNVAIGVAALLLNAMKVQERKALAKLERIKTWPKEHQAAAERATQEKLSQIREEMKSLA